MWEGTLCAGIRVRALVIWFRSEGFTLRTSNEGQVEEEANEEAQKEAQEDETEIQVT